MEELTVFTHFTCETRFDIDLQFSLRSKISQLSTRFILDMKEIAYINKKCQQKNTS